MEINKEKALMIFKNNFKYEICDTVLGTAVKMNSYDAFLYANVTGAGYLDNYVLPFTPKGLTKIFYNAFNYNFVTGIFDNGSLKYSPYNLSLTKEYLFNGNKYIIFVEFNSENELRQYLKEYICICKNNNIESTDFIIQRIETSKVGNGMESFLEYIACEKFKEEGYIVENQVPLAATVGSPDFAGYSLCELNKIDDFKSISNIGFHIIELSMLRFSHKTNEKDNTYDNKNIVGEAKTSTLKMDSQLGKYLNTGLYKYGFEMHPSKKNPTYDKFGLLTINSEDKIIITYPKTFQNYESDNYSYEDYEKWLANYMKFYLLANLSNDELKRFCLEKYNMQISNNNLISIIEKVSIKELLEFIKEVI